MIGKSHDHLPRAKRRREFETLAVYNHIGDDNSGVGDRFHSFICGRTRRCSVHGTDTIDAVIWSDNSIKFTGSKTVANALVAAGHWDAGSDFSSTRDSDAWTDSDDVKAGKSIGRDASSTDTNARADWYLFTSQTPGAANPTMGTPGDVLINEVAPGEDNEMY